MRNSGAVTPGITPVERGDQHQPAEQVVMDIDVRWSDLDTLSHVNHAVVVDLLGECRLRWMKGVASVDGSPGFADPLVVAALELDFARPVRHGLPLRVTLGIGRIGVRSFTVTHDAAQEGTHRVGARAVVVPLGPDGRPRALDDAERDYLSRHLCPLPPTPTEGPRR